MRTDYIRLEDNKITLFTRSLVKGDIYYCRFKIDKDKKHLCDNQNYITESMGTTELSVAKEKAKNRYLEIRFNTDKDISIKGKFVRDVVDDFLKMYEQRLGLRRTIRNTTQTTRRGTYSVSMFNGYKRSLRYWKEYIGDLELSSVKFNHYDNYEGWRKSYSKNTTTEVHMNSKDDVADTTLQYDINNFKKVMKWGYENNYYTGNLIDYKFSPNRNRRNSFSLEQYMKIVRYMRTKEFLEVGLYGNDKRMIERRKLFRNYFLFMCNTGLRKKDARLLKWRDITFDEINGKKFVRVRVSKDTKTGKSRETIGRFTARRSLERIREFRNHNLDDNDFVFCESEGNAIEDMQRMFKNVLDECGCRYDNEGESYCIYTMRHTYITFRLRYSKHDDIYAIAKNCGTSVMMIEQYYDDTTSIDYVEKLI